MITQLDRSIYLASRSPRRRELLSQIGVRFEVLEVDVNEAVEADEPAQGYVQRLARAKAEAGWQRMQAGKLPEAPVLGIDTTVALKGRIFGKPANRREAAGMLAALSGRSHEVLTAVTLVYESCAENALSVSEVQFKPLSDEEIQRYLATGECDDKAGAYAIQGRAAQFVTNLRGSFSGVMGLPLYETAQLLERMEAQRERRK